MSWQNILKAELTREGLIEYFSKFDYPDDDYMFSQDDVDVMNNIIENPNYTVSQLPRDKLNKFLKEKSDYDNVWDYFYGELYDIDFSKTPAEPTSREMFPENTFRYGY